MHLFMIGLGFIFLICLGFPLTIGNDDTITNMETSLQYLYTSFNSSYYEVVGLLNEEVVDSYRSSDTKYPTSKKEWNTQSGTFGRARWKKIVNKRREIDLGWFPHFAEVIRKHMNSSREAAVVQMRLACKSEGQNDLVRSAELAYRGESLLSYQSMPTSAWVPEGAVPGVESVKQDFNNIRGNWQNKATSKIAGFLDDTCYYRDIFFEYEKTNKSGDPRFYKHPSDSRLGPGQRNLSCQLTGFYPRSTNISFQWFKNNVPVVKGIWSSEVRPNGNHTYQIETHLVTESDDSQSHTYRCEMVYAFWDRPRTAQWVSENRLAVPEPVVPPPVVPAAVVPTLVVVAALVVLWYCKCKKASRTEDSKDTVMDDSGTGEILTKNQSDTASYNIPENDEAYVSGNSCDVSTEDLALLHLTQSRRLSLPPASLQPPDPSLQTPASRPQPPDPSLLQPLPPATSSVT